MFLGGGAGLPPLPSSLSVPNDEGGAGGKSGRLRFIFLAVL